MYILIRDSEISKVYVYNNLTPEAAENLEFMYGESNSYGFFSLYKSERSYDPAIAHEFLTTGEVHECNPVEMDYNAAGESGKFILCAYCERDMDE